MFVNVISVVIFYCAHWSTYCTGQLRFARFGSPESEKERESSRFDVTEAQMVVISVLLITAVFGDGIWGTPIVSCAQLIWTMKRTKNALRLCVLNFPNNGTNSIYESRLRLKEEILRIDAERRD